MALDNKWALHIFSGYVTDLSLSQLLTSLDGARAGESYVCPEHVNSISSFRWRSWHIVSQRSFGVRTQSWLLAVCIFRFGSGLPEGMPSWLRLFTCLYGKMLGIDDGSDSNKMTFIHCPEMNGL
jgi:hypothetical protein